MAQSAKYPDLHRRLLIFISRQGGRKAHSARMLGFERSEIQRFLRSKCALLEFNRAKLEAALDSAEASEKKTQKTQKLQKERVVVAAREDLSVESIALKVSRFITAAVERQVALVSGDGAKP